MILYTSGLLYDTPSPVNVWLRDLRRVFSTAPSGTSLQGAATHMLETIPNNDHNQEILQARRVLLRLAGKPNLWDRSHYRFSVIY